MKRQPYRGHIKIKTSIRRKWADRQKLPACLSVVFPYIPISIYEYTSTSISSPWAYTLWLYSGTCRMSCCLTSHLATLRTASGGSPSLVFNVKCPSVVAHLFFFFCLCKSWFKLFKNEEKRMVSRESTANWECCMTNGDVDVLPQKWWREVRGSRFYYRTAAA